MGLSMPGNVWYTIPVIQRNRPTGRREGGFMLQETLAYEVLSVVEELSLIHIFSLWMSLRS